MSGEKRARRDAEDRAAWDKLRAALDGVTKFAQAQHLVMNGPKVDEPGRQFYSNLGFFLRAFDVPGSASGEELAAYLALVERLDANGGLKAGEGKRIAGNLQLRLTK